MTRIDMGTDLACSAEQAWDLVTGPTPQHLATTAPGYTPILDEDNRFDRPGAIREVDLAVPLRTRVAAVVTAADEPHRLDYMVYHGAPLLRDHHGRIDIETTPQGCVIRWTVDVEFPAKLGVVATPGLRRQMVKSLVGLSERSRLLSSCAVDVAQSVSARPMPHPLVSLLDLRPEVDRQLGHQRLIADEFARTGDPKYWFARGFVLSTEEMLALIDAHVIENPDWLLHLMTTLHRRYVSNLHAYRSGGAMSPAWRAAWARCDDLPDRHGFRRVVLGTRAGTRAFAVEDLPAALAEVWDTHYRGIADYKDFRADYIRLAGVHDACVERLLAEMPATVVPFPMRLFRKAPPEVRDLLVRKVYYDSEADRMRAFVLGYGLTRRFS